MTSDTIAPNRQTKVAKLIANRRATDASVHETNVGRRVAVSLLALAATQSALSASKSGPRGSARRRDHVHLDVD